MLDKRGWEWYYIEAVREDGKNNAKYKKVWKEMKKVLDKRNLIWYHKQVVWWTTSSRERNEPSKRIWKNLKKVLDKFDKMC